MSIESCVSGGISIFSDWVIPEGIVQRRLGDFYEQHPVMSRLIVTPIALVSGILKVFLFPVICLVGVVVMPIIALVRACQGREETGHWLEAWVFCILGVAASATFLIVSCYYIPLIASMAIFVALTGISIILHVHKLVKEPVEPPTYSDYLSMIEITE